MPRRTPRPSHYFKEHFLKNWPCDVTFIVGPEQAMYNAHKMIVAAASPTLEAILVPDQSQKCVYFQDLDPKGFMLFLTVRITLIIEL
jgi:hypothetical protein